MIPELPRRVVQALADGKLTELADGDASTGAELYARGLARMRAGRHAAARADFSQAQAEFGDACALQLALLDIHTKTGLDAALQTSVEIRARAAADSALAAQAWHVGGLALGKQGRSDAAIEALLHALDIHRRRDDLRGESEVYDTLGMTYAAKGNLESAVSYYALSLVEKALVGDRYGSAITLGNLGRLHLRAGRFAEALGCFRLDLAMATKMGDQRGQARMLNDIARARLGMDDTKGAMRALRQCLQFAKRHDLVDAQFFAHKDRARACLAIHRRQRDQRSLRRAEQALAAAERILEQLHGPFFGSLLAAVRGELMLARGEAGAVEELADAAKGFAAMQLPDDEIPSLIVLAEAYAARGDAAPAQLCLARAQHRARRDGFVRYARDVREAFERLQLGEACVAETDRLDLGQSNDAVVDGYTGIQLLGRGAFGEVYRALDPLRDRIVAIKRLKIEQLYEPGERQRLLSQLHAELEGAALRHPGIARVFAIGTDVDDRTYIVQEFVEGRPLRAAMREKPALATVLVVIERVAAALAALHASGVVHRDIKPENIILRAEDDRPVLIDFGIAQLPRRSSAYDGWLVGTLPYMAPEQTQQDQVDGRSDVYAVGVVLYEWLAGRLPIELRGDVEANLAAIQTSVPSSLRGTEGVPVAVADLLDRMLAKAPSQRPSAAGVAAECRALRQRLGL